MPEESKQIKSFNATKTLLILIESIRSNLSFKSIAALLNSHQLLTSTGQVWTETRVKGLLSRLRRHKQVPTSLYKDLARLVSAGIVTSADGSLLLLPNKRGRK